MNILVEKLQEKSLENTKRSISMKKILKKLFSFITIFYTVLFISAVEFIYDKGFFTEAFIIMIFMILVCYKLFPYRELYRYIINFIKG